MRPTLVNLPFPVRGIDRSVPYAAQPGLTTHTAINVRPRPPISGRYGGGSRPALKKLFARQISGNGTADGSTTYLNRVNHLEVFPTSVSSVTSTDSLYNVEVTETFVGRTKTSELGAARTTVGATTASYNTLAIPGNIGSDLVMFCRNEANSGKVDNYYGFRLSTYDGSSTSGTLAAGTGGLIFDVAVPSGSSPNLKSRFPGVAVAYQTTNDIEAVFYFNKTGTTAGTGSGNLGGQNSYNGIGPFIRGKRDLSTYYMATLAPAAATTISDALPDVSGAVRLMLWSISSSGVATKVGTHSVSKTLVAAGASLCTIRIYQQGEFVNATCSWDGWGDDDVLFASYNAGTTPAVGDNATDPENRGGVAMIYATDGTSESGDHRSRCMASIKYTKRVPAGAVTTGDLDAMSVNLRGGRYFLPNGSASASVTSVPALAQFGEADANADGLYDGEGAADGPDAGSHNVPRIDSGFTNAECTTGVLQGMTATTRTSFAQIQNRNTGNTNRVHVEVRGRTLRIASLDSAAGINQVEDIPGVALRLAITGATNNWKSGLFIEWKHGAGKTDEDPYFDRAMQDAWDTIRVVGLANGSRTVLKTYTVDGSGGSTAMHMPPFRADAYQRWEDSGHALTSSSLRFYWKVNGIVMLTINPNSDISGWATFTGTTLNATDKTVLDSSKHVGVCFWPEATGTIDSYTYGGRVMDITLEQPSTLSTSETKSKVLAFTRGNVFAGDAESGTIAELSGDGPLNPVVSTASIYNRCFAVDGGSSVYMDFPFTSGVLPWVATDGDLPEKCRLVAYWMGRVVLAAPTDDPRLVYFSRVGDPFDWDYGADPPETAALALANSRFGLPAEPVIALIPGADDILYVCGSTTINAMVGDPSAGGQFVLVSPGVGIIGPRAWCIDDHGVIYFMGVGGLYKMVGASQPVNVSGSRLGTDFDNTDASGLFVQLEFDPVSRCIYIFRTNTDATGYSEHVVYDLATDSFWNDRYDGDRSNTNQAKINPWSSAVLVSSTPAYRRLIIGGNDGYIRMLSDTQENDDGSVASQPVITNVSFAVPDGGGTMETMLEDLTIFGHLGSDAFTIYHTCGDSMQDVANDVATDDNSVSTITVTAAAKSYQTPVSVRRRGGAHKLRLYSATADRLWGLEKIVAKMSPRGRRR